MKQRTTKEFIEKANLIHNNKYDYSKTLYTKKDDKVIIICPIHGEFEQIANSHVRGSGCKKCSFTGINTKTQTLFISEANLVHNNMYNYDKVKYINTNTKVSIICYKHGIFEQTPHNHLNRASCPSCSYKQNGFDKRLTTEKFIEEVNLIHNNKYDYSKTNYLTANDKIIIICPTHGEFEQKATAHKISKQGCPNCFNDFRKYNAPSWKKDGWCLAGDNSKNFDYFKLYVIKCFNEDETFYKVGRTFNKIEKRFNQLPYNYEIIKIIQSSDGGYIYDLENRIKNKYKHLKYIPKITFGGMHECFKP